MPLEAATEEASDAVRAVPPTRQTLSAKQMRVLLNALVRTPADVVQQVGFLLMLFVAVAEASLHDSGAPSTATAAHGHAALTTDELEWSGKLIAFATRKRERGDHLIGKGGNVKVRPKGVPNIKVLTLQRWATRQKKNVPRLVHLMKANTEIAVDDALLVLYHAKKTSPRDAGKALTAAATTLSFVTRVSGDIIAKSRNEATDSCDFGEQSKGVNVLRESDHHDGSDTEHRPKQETDHANATVAAKERTAAVVRVQALARGGVARRALGTANAAATVVQAFLRARTARHEAACRFATAAAVRVQALWRGVMSRDALFCRTVAAVTLQRWSRLTIVVRSLARTRALAQAKNVQVLQSAAVCAEYRFRTVSNLSISMSVHSRACRTAATLVQRRWTKVVKHSGLAARCHVFGEAERVLRSLVRRRFQQTKLDGVVRETNVDRCPSKVFEFASTGSTSTKMTCLEAEDEAWLVSAESLSKEERLQVWGRSDEEKVRNSETSNITNGAARHRSLDTRWLNDEGTDMGSVSDTPSGGTSINDPPAPTSESPPTSDNIASPNRSSHDDRASTLLGVGQLGSQPTSPTSANDIEHPREKLSSAQLSPDGPGDNMTHPPGRGRPVRLPVDAPSLSFAPVPLIFDLALGATTASSPGRDGSAGGSASPPTKDEAVHAQELTLREGHRAPPQARGRGPCQTSPAPADVPSSPARLSASAAPSSPERRRRHDRSPSPTRSLRDFSQPIIISPSDLHTDARDTTFSTPDRPSTGDGDGSIADDDSGQGGPESPIGQALQPMGSHNTSDGIVVEDLSTAGSFEVGDGLSTAYGSDDANAAVVWSKGEGSFRSNSLELPSEAGSYEPKDTLTDESYVEINGPPAFTSARITSSAPPSSTESTSSLLGLGLLRSRSSLSTYVTNDEESKSYTPLSTPPRRDGHSADTASSPERRRSAPLLRDRPGASLSQQTTPLDDVTVDEALIARNNPVVGTGHPLSSIPESGMSLDEAIVSLTGGVMEIDVAVEVKDEKLPSGGSPINVSHESSMPESAMSLDGAMLSPPAGTHSPSSRPSSATQPSPGNSKLRRREDSLSRTVETPGGRSWGILLSDVSSPSLTGSPRNFSQPTVFPSDTRNNAIYTTVSTLSRSSTGGGGGSKLADGDSGQVMPESPVGEVSALLPMGNTTSDGILVVGALSTAGSFEEGDGLSTVYDSDDENAATLWSRDDGSFRSKSLGLLSEIGGNLYKPRDTSYGSAEFNDSSASAFAVSIASSASDSSIESMPSLLSFGLLSSRSCPGKVERWEGSPSRPIERQGGGCSWWVSLSRAATSHVVRTRTLPALPSWLRAGGVGASLFTDEKESSSHDRPESPAASDTDVHASDTIEETTVTLKQAVVWPSSDSSKHIVGATATTDEAQLYGGGQIIGLGGDVILSAGPLALPLEPPPRTPSPSRRRSRSPHMTTPPLGTPPSPERWSPSAARSSPRRRRRRREGSSSTGSGAGRPRNHLSRSVSPLDSTTNTIATTTPPSSPDRLRTGTTVDANAGLLADDGSREGLPPLSSVGQALVLRRKGTTGDSDSGLIDGTTLSAAGSGSSSIEVGVGHMSTTVHRGSDYDDNDSSDRTAWLREEAILRTHSLMFLDESGNDTDGPDGFFDTDSDSDIASSQGTPPASSVNRRLSTPLKDVAVSDSGGLSGTCLGDVDSSDVGVKEVGLRDAHAATSPLLDTATVLSGSTPASPPTAQQAEKRKEASVEQGTAAEGLSGKHVVPPPGLPESAAKGSQSTEGAAYDVTARHKSAEETYRQQSRNPSAGVEEFKWSGLPNNI